LRVRERESTCERRQESFVTSTRPALFSIMAHRYTVNEVYRSVIADVIDRVRGEFVADGVAECVFFFFFFWRPSIVASHHSFLSRPTLFSFPDPYWTTCAPGGRPNCGQAEPRAVAAQGKFY